MSPEINPAREAKRREYIEHRIEQAVKNTEEEVGLKRDRGTNVSDQEREFLIAEARSRAEQLALDEFERGQANVVQRSDAFMIQAPAGQTIDIRNLVPGGDQIDFVRAGKFGYDQTRKVIMLPDNFGEQPAASVRVLRELTRATSQDKAIREERDEWEKVQALVEQQKQEIKLIGSEKWQEKYEEAEREATEKRIEAEKAIDEAVNKKIEEIKARHGLDVLGSVTEAEMRAAIKRDLEAQQNELVYPFDKEGKGYFTGEKPEGFGEKVKAFYQDSAPIQDMKYRLKLGKMPVNTGWVRYPVTAGIIAGYPMWKAGAYVFGGARNLVRNSLWKAERWGFRSIRASISGVSGAALEGLSKLVNGSLNLLLSMSKTGGSVDFKWGQKARDRYDKIMKEETADPPWKVEEDKKKKEKEKDKGGDKKKDKKKKKD